MPPKVSTKCMISYFKHFDASVFYFECRQRKTPSRVETSCLFKYYFYILDSQISVRRLRMYKLIIYLNQMSNLHVLIVVCFLILLIIGQHSIKLIFSCQKEFYFPNRKLLAFECFNFFPSMVQLTCYGGLYLGFIYLLIMFFFYL